ncbi:DUF4440 domain-containing protein [Erythrobacteraceae bacterium CFH 75059]|uniref:DUF4440 domain-containing protein n=1 Tax=Qipengyuania thermophila TaxID=2509361 RepID=UPI00101F39F6|nr:DUF4440 domain-containing protein [Qipengyuania thermophila]TCD06486.1 DUF4440 domain-containing protein [Erythrobacteraceae bacterium CFH 75059]
MDDSRIWEFEQELWTGPAEAYDRKVSDAVVMALPHDPWLLDGAQAREAVKATPRWDEAEFLDRRVERPQEGLIVIAYRVRAKKGERSYHALCTSTLRRLEHEVWDVVQHQQTPLGVQIAEPEDG